MSLSIGKFKEKPTASGVGYTDGVMCHAFVPSIFDAAHQTPRSCQNLVNLGYTFIGTYQTLSDSHKGRNSFFNVWLLKTAKPVEMNFTETHSVFVKSFSSGE
jgi:hypothetical protein